MSNIVCLIVIFVGIILVVGSYLLGYFIRFKTKNDKGCFVGLIVIFAIIGMGIITIIVGRSLKEDELIVKIPYGFDGGNLITENRKYKVYIGAPKKIDDSSKENSIIDDSSKENNINEKFDLKSANSKAKFIFDTLESVCANGKETDIRVGEQSMHYEAHMYFDNSISTIERAIGTVLSDNGFSTGQITWYINKSYQVVWVRWHEEDSFVTGQYPNSEAES